MGNTKIFEWYVLRVLSVNFILLGIQLLIYREWFIGAFLILLSFSFVIIGQSLEHNKNKRANDLLKGKIPVNDNNDIIFDDSYYKISPKEGNLLAKTFLILFLAVSVTLFCFDFRFYTALLLGFLFGFLYPTFLLFMGKYFTKIFRSKK